MKIISFTSAVLTDAPKQNAVEKHNHFDTEHQETKKSED